MGVFGHNDLFSRKYITAVIRDKNDRGYFVHIKKQLDEYFITNLNNTFYAFSMEGARIITHRIFAARFFQWVDFDTSHYKSIQYDKLEELKMLLIKNRLPRMNMIQFYMIKLLGRKERKKQLRDIVQAKAAISAQEASGKEPKEIEVPPHDMQVLLQELTDRQTDFPEESTNMINYIKSLDIDTIVTPCRSIAEYIEDDLIATKPSFLGELMPRITRLLGKHGQIVNSPYSTKNAWMMKLFWLSIIVVGVIMIAWMAQNHYFDFIVKAVPDTSSFKGIGDAMNPASISKVNQCTDAALQAKYTPEALKIAIESGSETCKLSETMQKLVDSVELPQVKEVAP